MEIGYHARRTLVPVIMEWIINSRMKEHLSANCIFVRFSENTLHFSLSHLSEVYKKKHVLPNLTVYALSLFHNLTPTIEQWCIKNNLQLLEFELWFSCEELRYRTKRTIQVKKKDKEFSAYLDQKST